MVAMHEQYPRFGWSANKGYGAPEHLEAIREFGTTSSIVARWQLPERTV